MKTHRLHLLITASLVILASTHAQLGTVDVFPLAPKLHFTYQYDSRSSYWELNWLRLSSIDSGTVEYIILDSTLVTDTLVVWSIRQHENLWHFRFDGASDTSYWSTRDSVFELRESRLGNHELQCSSWVWNFPLKSPTQPVTRFVEPSQSTIVRHYLLFEAQSSSGFDSLCFTPSLGLCYRYTDEAFHMISHILHTLKIEQVGVPTRVEDPLVSRVFEGVCRNYPNPFNSFTTIAYSLNSGASLRIHVFDLLGRIVLNRDLGLQDVGERQYVLDAGSIPTGVYFYRLHGDNVDLRGRFTLSK